MNQPAIETRGLSKTFRLYGNPYHRLKERLPWVNKPLHRAIEALADVNLTVRAASP